MLCSNPECVNRIESGTEVVHIRHVQWIERSQHEQEEIVAFAGGYCSISCAALTLLEAMGAEAEKANKREDADQERREAAKLRDEEPF